jgi:predicted small lipoprotein YifL
MLQRLRSSLVLLFVVPLTACGDGAPPPDLPEEAVDAPAVDVAASQDAFWNNLQALCGQAFRGQATQVRGTDTDFSDELTVHFRQCEAGEMRIPLHVGENRSRTWIVTRTPEGLRLKHDHRYEDGTEEELTQYGGDTEDAGTPHRQDFHVDDFTVEMLPEAATNVWTMEVEPGERFVYQLERVGTDRLVRLEFDLNDPVDPPPAPWGYEGT